MIIGETSVATPTKTVQEDIKNETTRINVSNKAEGNFGTSDGTTSNRFSIPSSSTDPLVTVITDDGGQYHNVFNIQSDGKPVSSIAGTGSESVNVPANSTLTIQITGTPKLARDVYYIEIYITTTKKVQSVQIDPSKLESMKILTTIACLLFVIIKSTAQPWKIQRDFKLAFLEEYGNYKLAAITKDSKIFYKGFDLSDSSKEIFRFSTIAKSNKKDGYFEVLESKKTKYYSILFEHGVAKELSYFDSDSSLFIYTLSNELLNGPHIAYYVNGNVKESGNYEDNVRIGKWTFFNNGGNLIAEGSYKDDYQELRYSDKGELVTLNRYLDTVKVESFSQKQLDSLKAIRDHKWGLMFPVKTDFKDGKWTFYDDFGKPIREEIYDNGQLTKSQR